MVVVAAGNVDHEAFAAEVAKAFAATPETPSGPSVLNEQAPAYFTGSDIRVRDDEVINQLTSPVSRNIRFMPDIPSGSSLHGKQFLWFRLRGLDQGVLYLTRLL